MILTVPCCRQILTPNLQEQTLPLSKLDILNSLLLVLPENKSLNIRVYHVTGLNILKHYFTDFVDACINILGNDVKLRCIMKTYL